MSAFIAAEIDSSERPSRSGMYLSSDTEDPSISGHIHPPFLYQGIGRRD